MYVCESCGAEAPHTPTGYSCRVCGGKMVYTPDRAATTLAEAIRLAEEMEEAPAELDAFIADLPEGVVPEARDGRFVFSSHELIRAGFNRRLQEYDLVRAAGIVFEILGYSYTGRTYIARVFNTEWPDSTRDLPKSFKAPRRRKKGDV